MYSEQIYFDPNYGVSGENVLSHLNVSKAKFFSLADRTFTLLDSSSSVIIYDLSQNTSQTIYAGSNLVKINHTVVVGERLYFCGKILNNNKKGFLHFTDYSNGQFSNVNLLGNASTANELLFLININSQIHYIQENLNGTYSLMHGNFTFTPSLPASANFKSAKLFSNLDLYLAFETFDSLYQIQIIKITNYPNACLQTIQLDPIYNKSFIIQDNNKHVVFNELCLVDEEPVVIYTKQDTIIDHIDVSSIPNYQLESNTIYFHSLSSSVVLKQLQIPDFFVDSVSTIIQSQHNSDIILIGYGYTTLAEGIKYIVISMNSKLNLNLTFNETGYKIFTSQTTLSPSRSEAILLGGHFYFLNVIYGNRLMITKITQNISFLSLSVYFGVNNKVYDGTVNCTVSGEVIVDGRVSGDDVSVTIGSAQFETSDVSNNKKVIALAYDLSGNSKYKYRIDEIYGTGNILQRGVTGYFITRDKNFDDTLTADVSSSYLTNVITQDSSSISFTVKTAQFQTVSDGFNKPVIPLTYDFSGNKIQNYNLLGIVNSSATIKLPIEVVYPLDSSENIYRNIPYKLRVEANDDQSFNIVMFSGTPPAGVSISDDLFVGTPTAVHNYPMVFYVVNKYGNRSSYKTYQINILDYAQIDASGYLSSDYLNLSSGSSFDLLDVHVPNLVSRVSLYYTNFNQSLILGSNLQNVGIQAEIPSPSNYKFLYGTVDPSKNSIGNFDFTIFLKIFNASGYIINEFREPFIVNFYLDRNDFNTFIFYVGKDPLRVGGEARLLEKVGNKYKYQCDLLRGDGANSIRGVDGNKIDYPKYIKNIFEHLFQFNTEIWMEYFNTSQLYIDNDFNSLRDELSLYYVDQFELAIPKSIDVSLTEPNM